MTTKIIQWSRPNKAGLYPLALRVTINRRKKYYFLPIATTLDNWDSNAEKLRAAPKDERTLIEVVKAKAKTTMYELMMTNTAPSFEMFDPFGGFNNKAPILHEYILQVMDNKKVEENISNSTCSQYKYVAKMIKEYSPHQTLQSFNTKGFMAWLSKNRKHNEGGLSLILSKLQTVYKKAIEDKIIQDSPIKNKFQSKPQHKGLSVDLIRQIKALMLPSEIAFARDMFMFSFYCRGINWMDIMQLKRDNIQSGFLSYQRSKSDKSYRMRLHPAALAIIEKYSNHTNQYIFNIIKKKDINEKELDLLRKETSKKINQALKEISQKVDVPPFTFYAARHSYADLLAESGANLDNVSESLGHSDKNITKRYVRERYNTALDERDEALFEAI